MSALLVIQHVPHERLGTFEAAFKQAGCSLRLLNAYDSSAPWPGLSAVDGIVAMGGPQSVYQRAAYPYLTREIALLRQAIERRLPILGVCLGAQLLASALGAKVTKAAHHEVGWYPLMREPGADEDPLVEPFGQTETVFQWHGDTFALPRGAVRLASSPLCREQAFRYRHDVYGLQFHLEVTAAMVRAWMRTPVNQTELVALRGVIDPLAIRRQSPQHVDRLHELSRHVVATFSRLVAHADHRGLRIGHPSRHHPTATAHAAPEGAHDARDSG